MVASEGRTLLRAILALVIVAPTIAVPLTPMIPYSSSLPSSASSHHIHHYSVSAHMQGVCVPVSTHSHSLDGLAETAATAASATVSNVVGLGAFAEPCLRIQVTAMKSTVVRPLLPSPHQSPRHPFLLTASTSLTSRTRCPCLNLKRIIPPRHTRPLLALQWLSRVRGCSPLQHLRIPEALRWVTGARVRPRPARPVDATQIRV